jgi:predicted RNA-binding Zn ribbon-like protein
LPFAPDTKENLEFVVALVNTMPAASRSGADELSTPEALTALLDGVGYTGRFDRNEAELKAVLNTRDQLRAVWTMPREKAVPTINRMLQDAKALPQLVRHDAYDWHLHATSPDSPLDERIRVEAALAFVDVVRIDEWWRLRKCDAPGCAGLLADLSRNGSKRFCSVRCGNRVNMIAFRSRAADA